MGSVLPAERDFVWQLFDTDNLFIESLAYPERDNTRPDGPLLILGKRIKIEEALPLGWVVATLWQHKVLPRGDLEYKLKS